MIVSASGRTDLPAFFTPWFLNRLEAGFFDVRNPFYPKSISRIRLEDVDAFMFCTKNPLPLIEHLAKIEKPVLMDVTITPYHREMEPGVPDKKKIVEGVQRISRILGSKHVAVRYNPIFFSKRYTVDYHLRAFEKLCIQLEGCADQIVISLLDEYKNTQANKDQIGYLPFVEADLQKLAEGLLKSSKKHGIQVITCHENGILSKWGIEEGACFSWQKAYEMTGRVFGSWKARDCQCVEMADIGAYNTCGHFCRYCYANFDEKQIRENMKMHDPKSSLLIGHLQPDDVIKVRKR